MAEIIPISDFKNKKAKTKNQQHIARTRQAEISWEIFSSAVRHIKNKSLTNKRAAAVKKLLLKHFQIKPAEIKIDDLIRLEFDQHTTDNSRPTQAGEDMAMNIIKAIQQNLINKRQAVRIIKVIKTWYGASTANFKKK